MQNDTKPMNVAQAIDAYVKACADMQAEEYSIHSDSTKFNDVLVPAWREIGEALVREVFEFTNGTYHDPIRQHWDEAMQLAFDTVPDIQSCTRWVLLLAFKKTAIV